MIGCLTYVMTRAIGTTTTWPHHERYLPHVPVLLECTMKVRDSQDTVVILQGLYRCSRIADFFSWCEAARDLLHVPNSEFEK